MKTSIKIALLVGTVLALINHHDGIIARNLSRKELVEIIITYLVPFSVATYSAARHARGLDRIRQLRTKTKIDKQNIP